jgi:hypothetical protein
MKLNFTILEEENNKRTYNEMCKNIGVELVKGIDSALDVHIESMLHE